MTLDLMLKILLTKGERVLLRHHRQFTLNNHARHSEDDSSEDNIDRLEEYEQGKYFD